MVHDVDFGHGQIWEGFHHIDMFVFESTPMTFMIQLNVIIQFLIIVIGFFTGMAVNFGALCKLSDILFKDLVGNGACQFH